MATNTVNTTARRNAIQNVHYARFSVNYNDAGIATGIPKGPVIPAGALIKGSTVWVTTAFNAATTNVLSFGSEATTYTNLVTTAQAVAGTPGKKSNLDPTSPNLAPLLVDTQFYALYTQSGTAATTGKAYVVIEYILDNDGA